MSGVWPKEAIYKIVTGADGSIRYCSLNRERRSPAFARGPGAAHGAPMLSGALVRRLPTSRLTPDEGHFHMPASEALIVQEREETIHDAERGTLCAFGMFWKRDLVSWSGKPTMLGHMDASKPTINFARQMGVYLLQDGARTIYVGRATDSLYARLRAHTVDRMAGRWNRFSWFGLRDVGADGLLRESSAAWSQYVVIKTIEALLIESLEPPLNRRRGDGLCGLEYLQAPDPGVDLTRKRQLLSELIRDAGLAKD